MKRLLTLAALLLVALPFSTFAEDYGEAEFMTACAVCHGESGLGDGPMAGLLNIEVPGLTRLAADNGGVFPVMETLATIDGRSEVVGHGGPMPVWGDRYTTSADALGGLFDAEVIARGRLLSLVYYLEAIQE